MANNVFADGNAVACKAGDGKVTAAFPDVCLSPPSPPAGPIPVPYPNSSFSKDMKEGSRSVKINGGEVMLRDQSYYKSSPLGDEAATRSFGANQVSHVITGTTYFSAWSMDVKIEGKNVPRHIDLTTSNHGSQPAGNPTPIPNAERSYKPVFTDAKVEGKYLCDCCGQEAHSRAQANGNSITEAEFYGPENQALLARIRSNPQCKHLLPNPKSKRCNKYYVTSPREKASIETDWGTNSTSYRQFRRVPLGTDIAHRVPKAAGGCPAGWGNLAPTGAKCQKLETALSNAQEGRISALRRAANIV